MKVTDILSVISPKLRADAERYAHKLGAAQTLFGKIRLIDEPGLLAHADQHIVRWHRLNAVIVKLLNPDRRLLNIAERLVVAVRIESAPRLAADGKNFDQIEDAPTHPCRATPRPTFRSRLGQG